MSDENPNGHSRLAVIEAKHELLDTRVTHIEQTITRELHELRTKMDSIWWKVGIMVGALQGAEYFLPGVLN